MGIAAQILAAPDTQYELVEVPEWGVSLFVRSMSAQQRSDYLTRLTAGSNPTQGSVAIHYDAAWAYVLQFCVLEAVPGVTDGASSGPVSPTPGPAVFTEDEVKQVLATKSGLAVGRLADVAMRLSGLDKATAENALGK